MAHGPSRSAARGIFPDQGSNPCPLHWQADSQPLRHQGSPDVFFYCMYFNPNYEILAGTFFKPGGGGIVEDKWNFSRVLIDVQSLASL